MPVEAITPGLVRLLAAACGLAVATNFYAQPILGLLARDFAVSTGRAGLVAAAAQAGYAVGLMLVVPLGDVVARRRLSVVLCAGAAAGLAAAAIAPTLGVLILASAAASACASVAQILVPLAAGLSSDSRRGAVLGTVVSGLLLGIVLGRAVSGVIADALGWRSVYGLASLAMGVLAIVLARRLPHIPASAHMAYAPLLRSTVRLALDDRVVQVRMLIGALVFAAFSAVWTSVTFVLVEQPFGYSETTIGAIALVGITGAIAARYAARLADAGHARAGMMAALLLASCACLLLAVGGDSYVAVILAGLIALDVGVQAAHVLNQSVIYARHPQARSRVTTAYITAYFGGGAVGSAAAAVLYTRWGWVGACAAAVLVLTSAALLAAAQRREDNSVR